LINITELEILSRWQCIRTIPPKTRLTLKIYELQLCSTQDKRMTYAACTIRWQRSFLKTWRNEECNVYFRLDLSRNYTNSRRIHRRL